MGHETDIVGVEWQFDALDLAGERWLAVLPTLSIGQTIGGTLAAETQPSKRLIDAYPTPVIGGWREQASSSVPGGTGEYERSPQVGAQG